ncbi:hypothetical protein [Mesorhizobium shangrilense]|uniref:Uncharacterized protein n=1 Tax=Mesorhizobium shangrilense TaxID=460060 RepID=A0ABV2DMW5_9HYPH
MDIRTPTHELTRAHAVLRTRRRIFSQKPDWALGRIVHAYVEDVRPHKIHSQSGSILVEKRQGIVLCWNNQRGNRGYDSGRKTDPVLGKFCKPDEAFALFLPWCLFLNVEATII